MPSNTTKFLVESYSQATARTRRVFIVLNVVSMVFFIGYFNHEYSWLRHKEKRLVNLLELENISVMDSLDIQSRQLLKKKNDVDGKFLKFNLIGAKVYVEDLPLIGSIALMILLTWFFYAIRRERGIIHEISNVISKEEEPDTIRYLFYGTSLKLLFNTIPGIDEEKISLGQLLSIYIRRMLIYLPTILLIVIICIDIFETFFKHQVDNKTTWDWFTDYTIKIEVIIRTIVPILLLIYCWLQSKGILQINKESHAFWKKIQERYFETCNNRDR